MGDKFSKVLVVLRGTQQNTQTVWERRLSLVRMGESDHKWTEEVQEKQRWVMLNASDMFSIRLDNVSLDFVFDCDTSKNE